jgi:hypothetical protein
MPGRPGRIFGLGVLTLALSLVPYVCGYLLAPQGKTFLGALNNTGDLSQYLAAIRQGSQGAWRYTNQFSPDHASRLLMYMPYLLAGHLSAGLPAEAVYQITRLLCGALLLYAIAQFCSLFVGRSAVRACWLFVVLAGSLYWLALLLSGIAPRQIDVVALTAPELSPSLTLLNSPHESLGLAAELMGFVCILRATGVRHPLWSMQKALPFTMRSRSNLIACAMGWFFVLALAYPFLLSTVGFVLPAFAVVAARSAWYTRPAAAAPKKTMRAGEVFLSVLRPTIVALFPAGLLGLYYVAVFRDDALWSHSGLAHVGPPSIGLILFAYAALAVVAYGGVRTLARMRLPGSDPVSLASAWFPVIWSVANLCTLALPIWQQGRQDLGLSIPLALLGFLWLAGPGGVTDGIRVLPAVPTIVLVFSAPLILALYTAVAASGLDESYYAPTGVAHAVSWLGDHASEPDVVLASMKFGNLVPSACSCHVVAGQDYETFDLPLRQGEVRRFYGARSQLAALQALTTLVAREHVSLVVYSPLERSSGTVELSRLPGFHVVYDREGVVVFRRAAGEPA